MKRKTTKDEVFRFADEVLRHFGLMLKVRIHDKPEHSMNWKEIQISKRVLECSRNVMKYIVAHEIGHRAISNAPETAANMLLIKTIALNEGIKNANLFLNVITDPMSDHGNLIDKPWNMEFMAGLREMLERAEKNLEKNYHPIYEWIVNMGKASLAEIDGKKLDFLSEDEYECYVLLFHDPRDWANRCRDLARKLRYMFEIEKLKRMVCYGVPFIRPIPWPVDQFDEDYSKMSEMEFEAVGKKLAGLYPKNLRFIHPRIIRYYRKWRIYSRLIPVTDKLQAKNKESFSGYEKWRVSMPLRELDVKATVSKYGWIIPQITTIKKVYSKEGREGGKGGHGACIIIIDKSGSMAGLRMERAVEASVGIVEQARQHGDLVSAIAFDSRGWLLNAPSREYDNITNKICGLIADGSTQISNALKTALKQPLNRHATFIITDCEWQDITYSLNTLGEITKKGKTVIFLLGETPENIDKRILSVIKQLNIKVYIHQTDEPFTFEAIKEYNA